MPTRNFTFVVCALCNLGCMKNMKRQLPNYMAGPASTTPGVYCQEVVFRADIQRGKGSAVLELPFCGIENSGYGRKLSGFGIQEFIHKNVRVVAEPRAGTTL